MTKFLLQVLCLVICFFVLCTVSALCEDNQIDINAASLSNLDKIIGIGPVLAQRIIDSRPFISVNDLIKVNGIGNITLEKIKQQNLACVSDENKPGEKDKETEASNETSQENISNSSDNLFNSSKTSSSKVSDNSRGALINLTESDTKDIKSKKFEFNSENLALYGLITFSLFIAVLFLIRKLKKPKTEFD